MLIMQKGAATPNRRRVYFRLVQSADGLSPLTGAAPTVSLRKNGGTSVAAATPPTEVGEGLYYVEATQAELSDLGSLLVTPTATGAITATYEVMVVDYDPITAPASTGEVAGAVADELRARLVS
jgi:hypothetical protein